MAISGVHGLIYASEPVAELRAKGIEFSGEPEDKGFGIGATMLLPGGAELLLYAPPPHRYG